MRISKKQFRNRIALDGIQFRQNSLLRGLHKVGYKKSAKDLAFDRERTKLQAEITQLRETVLLRDKTIRALADELQHERGENEKKQEQIEQLLGLLDLDTDDIQLLIKDAQRRKELTDGLKWLREFPGNIL